MNIKRIEEIANISKVEKWPYPKTFKALKEAGVTSYEVKTAQHQITYFNGLDSFREKVPDTFKPLEVSKTYRLAMLKHALKRVQAGQTDYEEFLVEIAEAGVQWYLVEMSKNTVTYFGSHPEEKYEELVPN